MLEGSLCNGRIPRRDDGTPAVRRREFAHRIRDGWNSARPGKEGNSGGGDGPKPKRKKGGGVRSEVEVGSVGRWNSGSEFSKGRWQQGDGRKGKIGVGLTQAVRREWESGKAVDWEDGVEFWWGGGGGRFGSPQRLSGGIRGGGRVAGLMTVGRGRWGGFATGERERERERELSSRCMNLTRKIRGREEGKVSAERQSLAGSRQDSRNGEKGGECREGDGRRSWGGECREGDGRRSWGGECREGDGRRSWGGEGSVNSGERMARAGRGARRMHGSCRWGNSGETMRSRGMAEVKEFSGRLGSEGLVGEGKM